MAFRAVHSWTLVGLILAFVDLAIAYFLLCVSACAFVPSKFLSYFGLHLPCPCSGFFGYQNDDLCLQRLLIDLPIRKVNAVQDLVKNRFPFNLIWLGHESVKFHVEGDGNRKCGNGVFELEGEACYSSLSHQRLQSSVDRKSGYDAKGKKVMNQKHKSGIQGSKRASAGCGKVSSALSSNGTHWVGVGVLCPFYDCSGISSEISQNLDFGIGKEDGFLGNQDVPNCTDFRERDGFYGEGEDINRDQLSVGNFTCDAEDSAGNDSNVILVLEQALAEEKAVCAALYQELEKERTAAATAADEAMAMISRLQEDKASIEMEAKQYQRVIEEKIDYDEEETNILKQILVRREREIHFLKKEVEAYEQMTFMGNDQLEGDSSYNIYKKEQKLSLTIHNENPLPALQQIENSKSNGEKEVATDAKCSPNYEHVHTLALGKAMMSNQKELASEFSASQLLVQKTPSAAGKEKKERAISMISVGMNASETCGCSGEKLEEDGNQAGCNMHSSMLDTESTVYDIHVIDDKTVYGKENGGKESGPSSTATSVSGFQNSIILSDCPTMSLSEIVPKKLVQDRRQVTLVG